MYPMQWWAESASPLVVMGLNFWRDCGCTSCQCGYIPELYITMYFAFINLQISILNFSLHEFDAKNNFARARAKLCALWNVQMNETNIFLLHKSNCKMQICISILPRSVGGYLFFKLRLIWQFLKNPFLKRVPNL